MKYLDPDYASKYQKYLMRIFKYYRPSPNYPTYPPYHKGLYLEDFFCDFFAKSDIKTEKIYIPVSWTTIYCEHKQLGLQDILDTLKPDLEYFTICQHDDIIKEKLPIKTTIFSCSQHIPNNQVIPIPVTCSRIPEKINQIEYFASFVGSYTHKIRQDIYSEFSKHKDCYCSIDAWQNSVSDSRFYNFLDITSKSKFTLCPRGYGNTSFRMYEAMQLGSVPVYISDDFCLPWQDEIDWNQFAIIVPAEDIGSLYDRLKSLDESQYIKMRNNLKWYYDKYFSIESVCSNIIKRIL